VEFLECSLLTTISFAWVKGMIAKAMMAGMLKLDGDVMVVRTLIIGEDVDG
jgi:hypothetical protein